jgi:predicted XRE-type DNA-binding protein
MTRKKTDVAKVDNAVHSHTADNVNVFAELGLDDADELLTRAKLGHTIRMILKKRGLKQRTIADLLKIDQAEVSKLMNGKYHLFSEGRLFGFLNRLDRKVTVQISTLKKDDNPRKSSLPEKQIIEIFEMAKDFKKHIGSSLS